MSEPFACVLHARLPREAVRAWLAAPIVPASRYDDWKLCDRMIDVDGLDASDWASFLATVDNFLPATHGEAMSRTRGEPAPLFRFYYDDAAQTLTHGSFFHADGAHAMVSYVTVARGLAAFLGEGDTGLVAIEDRIFGNGIAGLFELSAKTSKVVKKARPRPEQARILDAIFAEQEAATAEWGAAWGESGEAPSPEITARAMRDALDTFRTTR